MSAAGFDQATMAYLRSVRRARHLYRSNPGLLHENLKRLSDVRAIPEKPSTKNEFATMVAASLTDGLLRYTRRTQLLRKAATMGIPRFEANLIIALEEHRAGQGWTPEREKARSSTLSTWVAVIGIQTFILIAIWWALSAM